MEESAKVAKATVHGTLDESVMKVLKAAGIKPVQSLRIKPEKVDFQTETPRTTALEISIPERMTRLDIFKSWKIL